MTRISRALLALSAVLGITGAAASQVPAPRAAASDSMASGALQKATFGGGCFWCMEPPFDELEGVVSTTSGYMGGRTRNPTYEEVSSGRTGHVEVVQVVYDPSKVDYARLLEVYWRNVDPLTPNRQFCDGGSQYRSAIFTHGSEQARLAEASRAALQRSGRLKGPVVTEVLPAAPFYPAEEYHQDYYRKNPLRYKFYRTSCGRDARLREVWGKK